MKLVEGNEGRRFWANVRRSVGDGSKTEFWESEWIGQASLKSLFPRLYNLSTKKEAMIREMGCWNEERWVWDVEWHRELRKSEARGADELMAMLQSVSIREGQADRWEWRGSADG